MARHLIFVFVLLAGAGIPVQVASNHKLGEAIKSPVWGVSISLLIGGLAAALLALSGLVHRGHLSGASSGPWWAWVGGLLSAAVVIASIIALPISGAGAVIAATVFGQLVAAAILDHFGWLGVPQIRINWWRICGVVLLFGGALLMQKK